MSTGQPTDAERIAQLESSMPAGGLFAGHEWIPSPTPFPIPASLAAHLEKLGPLLQNFQQACNRLYLASLEGKAPPYIAAWMDAGKPPALLAHARDARRRNHLPKILRPDLLWGEEGLVLCELDSIPGGIGATAWLQENYASFGDHPVGGASGMRTGWETAIGTRDILISQEAAAYRPEMEWLHRDTLSRVCDAENYDPQGRALYRFFEAFDLPQIPSAPTLMEAVNGGLSMTPPLKPWLEEKLWLALLWLQPLEQLWRVELGEKGLAQMRAITPRGWVVDPTPLPPHAVLPGLDVQSWTDVAAFSQKRRRLVLKVSGFSERAWGSRGVVFGHDVSSQEWATALSQALDTFAVQPCLMQEYRPGKRVEGEAWDPALQSAKKFAARVRLCPYYFVGDGNDVSLGGVLATVCPADKKAIHGMRDAVMTVAQVEG